jgi:DNA-binding IclR family transcriptional regulator
MVNLHRFSKREIQEMLLKVIKRYPEGIGVKELTRKTGIAPQSIKKYTKDLPEIEYIDLNSTVILRVKK